MFGIESNVEFLSEIGINDAPEEEKMSLINGIEELIMNRLVVEMAGCLTETEAEEFNRIADEDTAFDWLNTHVPDFLDIVKSIVDDIQFDIINRRKMAMCFKHATTNKEQ